MNSKITGAFVGILVIIFTSTVLYIDFSTERIYQDDPRFFADHPNAIPDHILKAKLIDEISLTKIVEIDREKIFKIMADVNKYPYVLPKNIISVKILEQNDSTIIAEEEIIEQGIRTKLLVKHTFIPYDKQIIEILDGDAKGTKIIATFVQLENSTEITTNVDFQLHGILSPFGFLAHGNINSAMNTIILTFIDYAKGYDSQSEEIVDNVYREILSRAADPEALAYYSTLIENGEISVEDLRQDLFESQEFKESLFPYEVKNINELSKETKKIVDDIYLELLSRHVDIEGLQRFGSMIENNKMTENDLRITILRSEEYAYYTDSLVVDDVTVQDGIPIVLSWPLHTTSDPFTNVVSSYYIIRDKLTLVGLDVDEICSRSILETDIGALSTYRCTFEDHSVVEGNSYIYQIVAATETFVATAGALDITSENFSYTLSDSYPSFTGVAEISTSEYPK
tara:strand:- start:1391 stop:2755 length:1365 start_codon:yes stop_codon:yes gene_type:complete